MSRFLITGASGFVGPHLRALLESEGHEVWTSDRGHAHASQTASRHISCDLTDADSASQLCERTRPDGIFHLAGLSSVSYSFSHPQQVLQTNIVAACNVFEAMRRTVPRARVLVVGSAEQYGAVPASEQPIRESQPFRPASPYAVSKVAQEHLALQYAEAHGLDAVVTRSFNHTGPGQSDRFVLPSFARQIAEAERGLREPLLRVGNLDVQRDFLDVRDVVRAYALLMRDGESGQAYNICRGVAYRLRDLLDMLLSEARVTMQVEPDPERMRAADLPVLRGDATRFRERTGWRPSFEMRDTLRDVLDDWRRHVEGGATP